MCKTNTTLLVVIVFTHRLSPQNTVAVTAVANTQIYFQVEQQYHFCSSACIFHIIENLQFVPEFLKLHKDFSATIL